ncbi:MAG: glycosyl transferase, partial [Pseudomonadota bacterium]
LDRHIEEESVELFADNIIRAGQLFLENPNETPFISTWNRVHAADPNFLSDFKRAAAEDDTEFV